jgi:hypothetical protein
MSETTHPRRPRDVVTGQKRSPAPAEPARAPLSWLPEARWGTADTPLPPVEDDDPDDMDPDDELLSETPPDVIAMLGFDPLTDPDVMAMDAGEWDENKHPRQDDGKFGKGGGGGGAKNKTPMAASNDKKSPTLAKIHFMGKTALENDHDPHNFASDLIKLAKQFKRPAIANYANKMLRHFEKAHGLPYNSLGMAVGSTGGEPIMPKKPQAESPKPPAQAPKPAEAPKPAPSMKEQTAEAEAIWAKAATGYKPDDQLSGAIPEPHASSEGQKAVHAIATGSGSNANKVTEINVLMADKPHQFPASGYAKKYANEVITALGGKPEDTSETTIDFSKTPKTTPSAAPAAPDSKTVKPPKMTPRLKKATDLLAGAKRYDNVDAAGADENCPTLKPPGGRRTPMPPRARRSSATPALAIIRSTMCSARPTRTILSRTSNAHRPLRRCSFTMMPC